MEFKEALKLAIQSLWANKLRSILTLLGVVIGVASVIAVVTLVNGANTFVVQKFSSYGADVFTVTKQAAFTTNSDDYQKFSRRKPILLEDYRYVEENCKRCVGMGGQQASTGKLVRGTQSISDAQIRGYTWQMPHLQNLNITSGRDLTAFDEDHASHVAVIGTDVQENLFPGVDAIGQEIRADGTPYTVVGIIEKQGSTFGQSQDNFIGVPLTTYQKDYGTQKTITIYVKAGAAGAQLEAAADEVRVLMRARRHDAPGADNSFELDTNNTLVGFASQLTNSFGAVAGGIALISLVVGGIVIMNIMLVSVTERTREIGIRKALGARRSDVMMQVLIESVVMSVMGGLLGVALGAGITEIMAQAFAINLRITWPYVLLSLFVSSAVGIASGWYPASRASKLDPITALRAE